MPLDGIVPHGHQRAADDRRHINRSLVDPDVAYTPSERDETQVQRRDYLNRPANIDAEYAVLGGIYLANDLMPEIVERIETPDDFDNSYNRAIYRAMLDLYERGEPIDYVTVAEELRRTDCVDAAGGISNATSTRYADGCINSWRAVAYADIVAKHARKREVLAATQQFVRQIFQPSATAAQALAIIQQEIQPLADKLAENHRLGSGLISAADLLRLETPEISWPIFEKLPEGLALIGAPPKTGKSAIALQLALAITRGERALGSITQAGPVLYLALEDSDARLKERLCRQLDGHPAPDGLDFLRHSPPMLEGGLIQIESWLRTHEGAQAVFIDTLGRWRGQGSQTENGSVFTADYQDMARLQTLALNHHVAIVALHHLRKDRAAADPLEWLSGSTGMSAAADVVWILSRERNEEMGQLQILGRDLAEQNIAVRFSPDTLGWEAIGAADDVRTRDSQRKVYEALKASGHALTPSEIADFTGEKLSAVKMRCTRMKAAGLLVSVEQGRIGKYWLARQQTNVF